MGKNATSPENTGNSAQSESILRAVWGSFWAKFEGKIVTIILGIWLIVTLISLVWTPYSLSVTDGYNVWSTPSSSHVLGTDGSGSDILSWLMAGSATELAIVIGVVLLTTVWGLLGIAASVNFNRSVSRVAVIAIDMLIAIPTVVIALVLGASLGASVAVIIVACSFAYGLNLMRVVRSTAREAASSSYVTAARWSGVSEPRIFFTHIVPSIAPMMAVQLSASAGTSILAEAGLTYLGVGVPNGVASWGYSLSTSAQFISVYPLTVLWPGLVIVLAVLALNLLGDCLRDCCDPIQNSRLRSAIQNKNLQNKKLQDNPHKETSVEVKQ